MATEEANREENFLKIQHNATCTINFYFLSLEDGLKVLKQLLGCANNDKEDLAIKLKKSKALLGLFIDSTDSEVISLANQIRDEVLLTKC